MIPVFTVETDISGFESLVDEKRALLEAAFISKLDYLDTTLQARIQAAVSGDILQIRTGKLARSVEMIPAAVQGDVIEGSVNVGGGPAWYARLQEEGTNGPYEIAAKNAKALAFEMGGKQVFFKRVQHPGLEGKHFVKNTFEAMQPDILSELQSVPGEVGSAT